MLAGVGVICFTGSYAVALALELSRLVFRSGIRGAFLLGWAAAGLVAHSAYLYHEALRVPGSPLSSTRDWYLVASWLLVVVYLYLTWCRPRVPFGLFVLPLVLGLIGVAVFLADASPNPRGPASTAWGVIHGVSILLATVAVLVGFVAGLMYMEQARRLKRKPATPRRLRLPSLEWLGRLNYRAIVLAAAALGVGVASGMVLVVRSREGRVPWSDPTIVSTWVALVWLVAAALVAAAYPPARTGRRVAHLTVASFVVLVAALGVGLLWKTQHGGRHVPFVPPPADCPDVRASEKGTVPLAAVGKVPAHGPAHGGPP
ncbi:MAG: cytochrome c biogenesis protein CcsA [Pirellulales bacterium]|nr:cytochrome c biogenesis protein CcsA [Pirellulales bacterium]